MSKFIAGVALVLGGLLAGDLSETYAVDQLDTETVVLVRESDAATVEMPRASLPDAEEGAVYRWAVIWTRDHKAEQEIRDGLTQRLDSLSGSR